MEISTIGYRVYRGVSADASAMVRIGGTISAQGPGYAYTFEDATPPSGRVFYQIREIASTGVASMTEPCACARIGSRSTVALLSTTSDRAVMPTHAPL